MVVEVWDDDDGHIVGALHDFVDKYTLPLNKARYVYPDSVFYRNNTETMWQKIVPDRKRHAILWTKVFGTRLPCLCVTQ